MRALECSRASVWWMERCKEERRPVQEREDDRKKFAIGVAIIMSDTENCASKSILESTPGHLPWCTRSPGATKESSTEGIKIRVANRNPRGVAEHSMGEKKPGWGLGDSWKGKRLLVVVDVLCSECEQRGITLCHLRLASQVADVVELVKGAAAQVGQASTDESQEASLQRARKPAGERAVEGVNGGIHNHTMGEESKEMMPFQMLVASLGRGPLDEVGSAVQVEQDRGVGGETHDVRVALRDPGFIIILVGRWEQEMSHRTAKDTSDTRGTLETLKVPRNEG